VDSARRDRLGDDLRGVLEGELLLDGLTCALYATDASLFRVVPAAVVRPRHEPDVRAVVRYAAEHQIPLTARGAGTGTAGACLGPGVVIDFSRFMHEVVEVGPDHVRVQPGVPWERLTARLARDGRRIVAEPASASTSTLGGMAAVNSSGPRSALHGPTSDHLLDCRVVLDDGDAVDLGPLSRQLPDDAPDRLRALHRASIGLLERHAETIAAERSQVSSDRCGYRLHRALRAESLDYTRLLAGSEGTLGLFTELTLRTMPLPGGRGAVLFGCPDLETALRAARAALPRRPAATELLDGRLLSLLRGRDPEHGRLVPAQAGAALLLEFEADSPAEARRQTLDFIDELVRGRLPALLAMPAFVPEDAARLWAVVDAALPSLSALRGGPQAVPVIEDVAVPVERLSDYLARLQGLLQRHQTTAAFMVHAAAGQVHARPILDPTDPADAGKLWAIAEDVTTLVLELGGTISARHGTGLSRTPWVAKQCPRLAPVFRELKAIFDPRGVFNPGNVVGPDPNRPAWPLRGRVSGASREGETGRRGEEETIQSNGTAGNGVSHLPVAPSAVLSLSLVWQTSDLPTQAAACNGCGACRTQSPARRMCPVFRATRGEEATPRAKANLLQTVLAADCDPRRLSADDVREVADLCVNCKMCATECPSRVNIPKLMLEAKAAHVAEHGLDRGDWALARVAAFAAAGSAIAPLTNRLLRGRFTRWFLEKFFGIARRRGLPPFAPRSFLRLARKWGWTTKNVESGAWSMGSEEPMTSLPMLHAPRSTNKVALFVDIFANYHDPAIAEAAVRVLRHHGVDVVVPLDQRSSGMEALSLGDVETARELARSNLRVFAELARDGYSVVCPEPTAALALRHDYLDLLDDPDARLVAGRTVELTTYLGQLHAAGEFRTDFQTLDLGLGHHVPCHQKALGVPPAAPALLALIPGVRVHTIDVGCSGMAGTYGLKATGYQTSLAAGRPLFDELRRPRVLLGSTECSSCRMQMEEGAGKVTLHPVQYLALAYGLMPELAKRLLRPVAGLVPR
jgi:FAD/FMN-containing dehydrogenase/Fe-S oxidoreductase